MDERKPTAPAAKPAANTAAQLLPLDIIRDALKAAGIEADLRQSAGAYDTAIIATIKHPKG